MLSQSSYLIIPHHPHSAHSQYYRSYSILVAVTVYMLHACARIFEYKSQHYAFVVFNKTVKGEQHPTCPLKPFLLSVIDSFFSALGPHWACWFSFHDFIFHGREDILTHMEKHAHRHTKNRCSEGSNSTYTSRFKNITSCELLGQGRNYSSASSRHLDCICPGQLCNPSNDTVLFS